MNKFFVSIIVASLLACASGAFASEAKEPVSTDACKAGCGHEFAPGAGTGRSRCWVTFIAEPGYEDFQAQILSPSGVGLLKNAKGQVAIRGGKGTTRISVDCSVIVQGVKLLTCFTHDGKPVKRSIWGAKFKGYLTAEHLKRQGGEDIQLF